jgi:ATP-binding cassette subfamily B protein
MKYFAPHDLVDCGVSCLRMVCFHYGKEYSSHYLRKISFLTRQGVSLLTLGQAAEKVGFKVLIGELSLNYLVNKAALPCILFWDQSHFVVLHKVKKKYNFWKRRVETYYYIADPGRGKVKLTEEVFKKFWLAGEAKGYGLFLEPTSEFYSASPEDGKRKKTVISSFGFLSTYFSRYKRNYLQVAFAMLFTAFVSLLIPYLTQSIIDHGVQKQDLNFVTLAILFQLAIFISNTFAEVIRAHLLLHISARVNISILTDFLLKLMRLPISFFESKMAGDVMQRINDHQRIESFISSALLGTFFSCVNLVVFLFVLSSYDLSILAVFLVGSVLSVAWTTLFLKWRKSLDYFRFREMGNANDKLYEMVNGIPEIKVNSFENYKQSEWREVQFKLFRINLSNLKLDQYQKIGSGLIDQVKNVVIIFVAASAVISGEMTLGMMLAISYVIGQLNMPVRQILDFLNTYQFTKVAVERMTEVYSEQDEEKESAVVPVAIGRGKRGGGIEIKNVSFQYEGPKSEFVLKDVSFSVPEGKVTAIVGSSGSGKTTLLKLLLRFHDPVSGDIYLNDTNLENISPKWWRGQVGCVMQEGYIFSDTIKRNIMMGDESENMEKLLEAAEVANIEDFVTELPLHVETRIGASGMGLSTGQKQRILIARAVYKSPSFLFFDEATSALDARNERVIMQNLNRVFNGKTVLIIAHRLSTVKNADQIVVLEKGEVVEVGTHAELILKEGYYFNLIKNQLELGV